MDSFDLNRTSKFRINNIIQSDYGGRYSTSEIYNFGRVGVGGIIFYDDSLGEGKHVKVTLERFKKGLAIYFRNIDENKMLIFKFDELTKISLIKEEDILVRKSPSIFSALQGLGLNYYYARMFLFDHEIINEYKAELTILPKNYEAFKMFVSRKNPKPIVEFIKNLEGDIQNEVSILTFSYV